LCSKVDFNFDDETINEDTSNLVEPSKPHENKPMWKVAIFCNKGLEKMSDDDSTSLHSQSNVKLNHLDLISTKVHLALVSTKQLPPTQEIIYGLNFAPISSLPNVNIEKVEVSVGYLPLTLIRWRPLFGLKSCQ